MARRRYVQHLHRSRRWVVILISVLATSLVWVTPAAAAPGDPLSFTVTSTGDSGDADPGNAICDAAGGGCTLRAAIQEANAQGSPLFAGHTITFDIAGGCSTVCSITPGSPLPDITAPVVIDGYSQSGAQWGTAAIQDGVGSDAVLRIELDGSSAGPSNGLTIAAGPSTIQGLVIDRFRGAGIVLSGTGGNGARIYGNYIGTDRTGTIDLGNVNGIIVNGAGAARIGGVEPSQGNVISGNNNFGIVIQTTNGNNNKVQGNYIGTDATGLVDLGNVYGIGVFGSTNTIGGPQPGARNVISGNDNGVGSGIAGVFVSGATATGNIIQGNLIGTDVTGLAPLGNMPFGVYIDASPDTVVGGTGLGEGNTIAFNSLDGVRVNGATAVRNQIRGNSIHDHAGKGITLASGGNVGLAAPVVSTTAPHSASGTACAGCTVDVYSDGVDEGRVYEGTTTADGAGAWTYQRANSDPTLLGPAITATSTDPDGNTSAFSAAVAVIEGCAPGSYSATGNVPCTLAPAGSYVAVGGSTSATLCVPGTFSATAGATQCDPAPAEHYVPTAGATAAIPCPAGTWTNGSIRQTACVPIPHWFTVVVDGTGGGTVTSTPSGIDCAPTCYFRVGEGTVVDLVATADPGSRFVAFGGDPDCADGSVTVTADVTCTATFDVITGSVPSATGAGSIGVTTSDGSLTALGAIAEGTLPTAGKPAGVTFPFGFVGWTVNGLGPGQTINVTITYPAAIAAGSPYWKVIGTTWVDASSLVSSDDGDATIILTITDGGLGDADGTVNGSISDPGAPGVVTITPPTTQTLTVLRLGTGSGAVTSTPAGIDCGADCSEAVATGTVVVLTATPAAGSTFNGWSGNTDCSDGSVTMSAARTCKATFKLIPSRTLTVTKAGTGSGSVTSDPAGIACGADCSEAYLQGTVVALMAVPDAGSTFDGWSGNADCADGTVTMTASKTCRATFKLIPRRTLTVTRGGTGSGSVTSTPAGIACGLDCSETYLQGTVVDLTATPASGSTFVGWSGNADCTDGRVTMTASKSCKATFKRSSNH